MGIFERFRKNSSSDTQFVAGISVEKEHVRGVVFDQTSHVVIAMHSVAKTHDLRQDFENLAEGLDFEGAVAVCLANDTYQFVEVDRPQVDEKEILQAIGWSVKELLKFPVENAIMDFLEKPAQATGQNKLNLVVAEDTPLKDIVAACNQQIGQLQLISVYEVVLRRLLEQSEQATLMLFQLPGQELLLQIIQDGKLYFARRLRGFNRLSQYTKDELSLGALDTIGLEIQRSTDYFESQLKQAPISNIVLCLDHQERDTIVESISSSFSLPVSWLALENEDGESIADYALAIAAAKELLAYRVSDEAIR